VFYHHNFFCRCFIYLTTMIGMPEPEYALRRVTVMSTE